MHLGAALDMSLIEVELLIGYEGFTAYQLQTNSEYHNDYPGSQTMGANLHGRKGNSPDRQLRSQNPAQLLRKLSCYNSQDVGLEAAII